MRRLLPLVLAAFLIAACGHHTEPTPGSVHAPSEHFPQKRSEAECPAARDGHGSMGICAPHKLGLGAPHPQPTTSVSSYADLSNNDACYCGAAIRSAGHVGLIVKANQGVGFIDWTATPMVASARHAGLAVGMYDFDETYSLAEARLFVARLHAARIYPSSRNTFPAVLDVEFGAFSLNGLRAQIRYIAGQGYRVAVYTGAWFWTPHAGCVWVGVSAWLAGYPTASVPCGMWSGYWHDHQYTDRGRVTSTLTGDLSVHFGTSFAGYVNDLPIPKPRPKPSPNDRQLIAHWRAERAATLRRYRDHGCRPSSRRPACVYWRRKEHTLYLDIRHRQAR